MRQTLAARGEMDSETFFETLASLIDAWCDRRALNPLRLILPAYPMASGLTDSWEILLQALYDIRAFCRESLPEAEMQQVEACIIAAEQALAR
jgi:hypothetical protein